MSVLSAIKKNKADKGRQSNGQIILFSGYSSKAFLLKSQILGEVRK